MKDCIRTNEKKLGSEQIIEKVAQFVMKKTYLQMPKGKIHA